MNSDNPQTENSVAVDGNVIDSNIIIGDNNSVTILPKKATKKRSPQFIVTIFLGTILPLCACLITSLAFVSRYYLEGIWTTGVKEIVSTTAVLFGVIIIGIILFIIGIGQFGAVAFAQAAKVEWIKLLQYSWKTLKDGIEYIKAHPNWMETVKNFVKPNGVNSGWQDLEIKERITAIVLSFFVPGLGLVNRGRKWWGIGFFVITVIGYLAEVIPGILLHLVVIVLSGVVSKPKLNFPQIQNVTNLDLRKNLTNSVKYLNDIESIDAGLFYLAKIFETELKAFLVEAKNKNVFPVQEKDLQKLVNMIECLERNKVELVLDKPYLTFLRQERNEIVHGGMLSYEKKKQLMKQAPFLGNLYIDCSISLNQKRLALQESSA